MADNYIIKATVDEYTKQQYRDAQMAEITALMQQYGLTPGAVTGEYLAEDSVDSIHIKLGAIDAVHISEASITSAAIQNAAIQNVHLGTAVVDSANIANLAVKSAHVSDAQIKSAHIDSAQIKSAHLQTAIIDNSHLKQAIIDSVNIKQGAVDNLAIKAGAVGTTSIGTAAITTALISDLAVTDAKIDSLTADKIIAGKLDTGKVTVSGVGGHLTLNGNRMQVFDNSPVPIERVSIGDVNSDGTIYGFRVRGEDGTTVLYDEKGVYNQGITDGAITNPKIQDDSIDSRVLMVDSVLAGHIKAGEITSDHIKSASIIGTNIAGNTITANNLVTNTITAASGVIANAAITNAMISDLSVTNAKIQDGTITSAKIDTIRTNQIIVVDGDTADGNIALGIATTGTVVSTTLTDGVKVIGSPYTSFGVGNSINNAAENEYLQLDFGKAMRIEESRAYFYSSDDRYYYYKIKYSLDGVKWYYAVGTSATTGWKASVSRVTSGITTGANPTIDRFATPITARYIRVYANGNTTNTTNHMYEWELFSAAVTKVSADSITTGTINSDVVTVGNANVTISSSGVNVKNGSFTLQDDVSTTKYSIVKKKNAVIDHSFEMCKGDESTWDATNGYMTYIGAVSDDWTSVGSPKLAYPYMTEGYDVSPFGKKSMVVNSTSYVYQALFGLKASKTYTLSAFFKKYWSVAGGTPQFYIRWYEDVTGTTLWSTTAPFTLVPSDGKLVRFSTTFTLPSNYADGDGRELDIRIMGKDASWVQVDGIQFVEGTLPTIYDPEDSVWGVITGEIPTKGLKADVMYSGNTGIVDLISSLKNRLTTDYGNIEFGPMNAQWAHIYSSGPNFYFNKSLYVLGDPVIVLEMTGGNISNASNGVYLRYSDGTQICYVYWDVTDQSISGAYGTAFQGTRAWTFPAAFTNGTIPTVICTEFKHGTGASWGTTSSPSTNTGTVLRGLDLFTRATGTNVRISAMAIGRWKF